MKKLFKVCWVLLVVLVLLCSVTACGKAQVAEEDPAVRQLTEEMLDAFLADDEAAAYKVIQNADTPEAFSEKFPIIRDYLGQIESYTLTLVGNQETVTEGVTQYTALYMMETEQGYFEVTVSQKSDTPGLYAFHAVAEKDSTPKFTGTLSTMGGATLWQWVLLLVGLGTYAFVIWMVIDCVRRPMKLKWLVLLMLVLGSVAFLYTVRDGKGSLDFGIMNLLSYTALMIYKIPPDAMQLRIFLPVGAMVYFFLRKRLSASWKKSPSPKPPSRL